MRSDNPYNWEGHRPRHHVPREALLARITESIQRGHSGYLVGCRGMGKSAFLYHLGERIGRPELDVLQFPRPSIPCGVAREIQAVADEMVKLSEARGAPRSLLDALKDHSERLRLRELFDTYLGATPHHIERLVLVYDELDAYAEPREFGRDFFGALEDIRKTADGRLVVFAAGGLGLVALDTLLGSSFFARLNPEILEPFNVHDLVRLAEPFEQRGTPLSEEVMETLHLATGGNPALATFGLEEMWTIQAPSPRDVTAIFDVFRDKHSEGFLDKIRLPIFDSDLSNAPELVWREFRRSGGRLTRKRLKEIIQQAKGPQKVQEKWIFNMLRSTGLIRASDDEYRRRGDIQVDIIPSILTLDVDEEEVESERATLREQLVADLCDVLTTIHRMAPDFFREKGEIVREAVFSAGMVLGLEPRGWRVEREAQSATGRTDIKARHDRFGEKWAVIEVKHWNNSDSKQIHAQVVSYWSPGIEVLATVMVAHHQDPAWPDDYKAKCLDGKVLSSERREPAPALAAHFVARTDGCPIEEVDHLLLQLPRRR